MNETPGNDQNEKVYVFCKYLDPMGLSTLSLGNSHVSDHYFQTAILIRLLPMKAKSKVQNTGSGEQKFI